MCFQLPQERGGSAPSMSVERSKSWLPSMFHRSKHASRQKDVMKKLKDNLRWVLPLQCRSESGTLRAGQAWQWRVGWCTCRHTVKRTYHPQHWPQLRHSMTLFVPPCSEEQRLASELDYLVFRRILTPLQVCSCPCGFVLSPWRCFHNYLLACGTSSSCCKHSLAFERCMTCIRSRLACHRAHGSCS
jgi:hypothetical protein